MRKFFCAVIFASVFLPQYIFAATVSMPDAKGSPGSVVSVPVNIDNPTGIVGCQITVNFDGSVLKAETVLKGSLTEGWMIFGNTEVSGQVRAVTLNPNLQPLGESPGSLFIINFTVLGDIEDLTQFDFTEVSFHGDLAESLEVASQPGSFEVDFKLGDINGDGEITISDVILCLRIAIGLSVTIDGTSYGPEYPEWLLSRANMKGHGDVNISDVILILRKAIGLE